jgi:hypothetical protein
MQIKPIEIYQVEQTAAISGLFKIFWTKVEVVSKWEIKTFKRKPRMSKMSLKNSWTKWIREEMQEWVCLALIFPQLVILLTISTNQGPRRNINRQPEDLSSTRILPGNTNNGSQQTFLKVSIHKPTASLQVKPMSLRHREVNFPMNSLRNPQVDSITRFWTKMWSNIQSRCMEKSQGSGHRDLFSRSSWALRKESSRELARISESNTSKILPTPLQLEAPLRRSWLKWFKMKRLTSLTAITTCWFKYRDLSINNKQTPVVKMRDSLPHIRISLSKQSLRSRRNNSVTYKTRLSYMWDATLCWKKPRDFE